MTEQEFRKLKPLDLIQILLAQGNEVTVQHENLEKKSLELERLIEENEIIKAKLNDRDAMLEVIKQGLNEGDERIRDLEEEMKKLYSDRRIELEDAGSLVQAALELNKIFEAAQMEAEQYIHGAGQRIEGARFEAVCMVEEDEEPLQSEEATEEPAQPEEATAEEVMVEEADNVTDNIIIEEKPLEQELPEELEEADESLPEETSEEPEEPSELSSEEKPEEANEVLSEEKPEEAGEVLSEEKPEEADETPSEEETVESETPQNEEPAPDEARQAKGPEEPKTQKAPAAKRKGLFGIFGKHKK